MKLLFSLLLLLPLMAADQASVAESDKYYEKAKELYFVNDLDQAAVFIRKALEINPENVKARKLRDRLPSARAEESSPAQAAAPAVLPAGPAPADSAARDAELTAFREQMKALMGGIKDLRSTVETSKKARDKEPPKPLTLYEKLKRIYDLIPRSLLIVLIIFFSMAIAVLTVSYTNYKIRRKRIKEISELL